MYGFTNRLGAKLCLAIADNSLLNRFVAGWLINALEEEEEEEEGVVSAQTYCSYKKKNITARTPTYLPVSEAARIAFMHIDCTPVQNIF